jgi:plasmid stabilization system protein ParE
VETLVEAGFTVFSINPKQLDRYTVSNFGEAAADRYDRLIRQALRDFQMARSGPAPGLSRRSCIPTSSSTICLPAASASAASR